MPKSEGKHEKTNLILPHKKEDTQSSCNSLKQLIDNSIVLAECNRFRSTRVSLLRQFAKARVFGFQPQRNPSCVCPA